MPVGAAERRFRELLGSMGRPGLSALFPKDFEVYMMMLELVDSRGDVADYLSFPVMPNDITKSEPELTNIKKSAAGVISIGSESFNPQDITINGNFGRSFKVLVGTELVNFKAYGASLKALSKGKFRKAFKSFNVKIKTGYGCTKILKDIVTKSTKLDNWYQPYKLYFHNPSLGESYLVEKMNLTLRQDKNSNNMIWAYSLSFKILANADDMQDSGASSLKKLLIKGIAQKGVNTLTKGVGEVVRKNASSIPGVGQVQKAVNLLGGNI